MPVLRHLQEAPFAQRTPNAPQERRFAPNNWYLQAGTNEIVRAVTCLDDTLFPAEFRAVPLLFRQHCPLVRRVRSEGDGIEIMLGSAGCTREGHSCEAQRAPVVHGDHAAAERLR